ncbi:Hypothetical protein CKL_1916 [Clostridium kluyveri DSM 555]|uniref:Uncharacterized protein n=1 Tax=Clostridium kluyveri (strain ATCC 8527 / DSM 555 / NBRC 12016 / NCIMB 10680 / K1) TaxID=431943 RepID=A5MYI2_CLOK5|nr:Hypothetical protein CKL_1916 [Clostridium kluyveri DSM 555]
MLFGNHSKNGETIIKHKISKYISKICYNIYQENKNVFSWPPPRIYLLQKRSLRLI